MRFLALSTLLVALMACVGCGPIVMIPGGTLSGDVASPPDNWAFTDDVDTVQLETRPSDPYSVNVWAVAVDRRIFVVAGGGAETTWAQHIEADDRVRLRVGEAIYELRATADADEATREAFLAGAKKKYDFEPEGEDTSKAILYRLDPR